MKKISVVTNDLYLFQKIKLALKGAAVCTLSDSAKSADGFDAVLIDSACMKEDGCRALITPSGDLVVKIPFSISSLTEVILSQGESEQALALDSESRRVRFKGRFIKLTELEYDLLELLLSRGGEPVTREEILAKLWGGEADSGVVNVYIHYLREKLEYTGEKVIISSRKLGYGIDKKYIKEGR